MKNVGPIWHAQQTRFLLSPSRATLRVHGYLKGGSYHNYKERKFQLEVRSLLYILFYYILRAILSAFKNLFWNILNMNE